MNAFFLDSFWERRQKTTDQQTLELGLGIVSSKLLMVTVNHGSHLETPAWFKQTLQNTAVSANGSMGAALRTLPFAGHDIMHFR